jgi:hypothetical protein
MTTFTPPFFAKEIEGKPATKAAVCHDGIASSNMFPELAAEVALAAAKRSGCRADPYSGGKIEQAGRAA